MAFEIINLLTYLLTYTESTWKNIDWLIDWLRQTLLFKFMPKKIPTIDLWLQILTILSIFVTELFIVFAASLV